MMNPCPKCGYERRPHETHVHAGICPACGVAYEKWLARQQNLATPVPPVGQNRQGLVEDEGHDDGADDVPVSWRERLQWTFLSVPPQVDGPTLCGRAVVWLAILSWALYFTWHGIDWEIIGGSFLHNINLAFHEFGHVFFSPFGDFMMILGGSLFQVLLPLGLLLAFSLLQADNFGASVMLWWCGQSFVDVSPYIRDAEYRGLPLVGGGTEESHDWGNLLTMLDAVRSCYALANTSFAIGVVLMFAGLGWGLYLLWHQYLVMNEADSTD